MPELGFPLLPDDSGELISATGGHISAAVRDPFVRSVFISRVRGWFGRRWLGFSGKTLGALGISYFKLTVPPFVPSRIASSSYFVRTDEFTFVEAEAPFTLHPKQASSTNLKRYLADLAPDSALFWLSTESQVLGRAAFMSYIPTAQEGHHGLYVGYSVGPEFKVSCTARFPGNVARPA